MSQRRFNGQLRPFHGAHLVAFFGEDFGQQLQAGDGIINYQNIIGLAN